MRVRIHLKRSNSSAVDASISVTIETHTRAEWLLGAAEQLFRVSRIFRFRHVYQRQVAPRQVLRCRYAVRKEPQIVSGLEKLRQYPLACGCHSRQEPPMTDKRSIAYDATFMILYIGVFAAMATLSVMLGALVAIDAEFGR